MPVHLPLPPLNRLPLPLRLALFGLLERVSNWRRGRPASGTADAASGRPVSRAAASLWVFASTIGEVHAIEPFLDRLRRELGDPPLTLISDRATYGDAYRVKFPQAQLEQLDGSTAQVKSLLARHPPLMLLVAEIPALLHDAPCRLSFATLHAARSVGAPVVLVNGWVYGYPPPSRLDRIENRLFGADYAAAFDLALVQTGAVRNALVAAGADEARVHVTGNIKFDAMAPAAAGAPLAPLQAALAGRGRGPVLVAGSVTETQHQRAVIEAFVQLRNSEPEALLVLAPRHPEDVPRMTALRAMLETSGLDFRYRSQHLNDPGTAVAGDLLVLDTIGELRGSYATADAAFVGVDHNVLEPLAFGKPTFVCDGWEPTYPSYPVYRQLRDAGVLCAVESLGQLGAAWEQHFAELRDGSSTEFSQHVQQVIEAARGAVGRSIEAMRRDGLLGAPRDTAAVP